MAVYTDTSGATITTLIPSYYNKVWLERLEANLVLDKYGQKTTIPRGEGSSVIWHALKNIGVGYTLDENTPAGTSAVSTRKVSAVPVWKAQLVEVSTRVVATAVNPMVKEVVAAMGYSAALTKEEDIGFNIGFGSCGSVGASACASIALPKAYTQGFPLYDGNTSGMFWGVTSLVNGLFSSTPTIAHIRGAVTQLRNLNALPFDDGLYRGIIDPDMSMYLRSDTNFATWMAYTNRSAMERGKLGTIEQVLFEESTVGIKMNIVTSTWSGFVSGGSLHGTLIFGRGAYGVTGIRGEDAKVDILDQPDKSDPHNLHVYISYKFAHASKILNASAGIMLTTWVA